MLVDQLINRADWNLKEEIKYNKKVEWIVIRIRVPLEKLSSFNWRKRLLKRRKKMKGNIMIEKIRNIMRVLFI